MRFWIAVWAVVLILLGGPAHAEDNALQSERVVDHKEIEKWVKDYKEWRRWAETHGNRPKWTSLTYRPAKRPERPAPPSWLKTECASPNVFIDFTSEACELLREYDDDLSTIMTKAKTQVAQVKQEKQDHSSFLKYVHFDGLWTVAQFDTKYRTQQPFGILGMHVAIPMPGYKRLQIIIPPGAMVFTYPYGRERKWAPGATFGGGLKLFEFDPRIVSSRAALHLNFVRAIIPIEENIKTQISMVGGSVTFGN